MGFFRKQEERLAVKVLAREYEKNNLPLPPSAELSQKAAALVDQAHQIARQGGKNVVSIMADLVRDLKK